MKKLLSLFTILSVVLLFSCTASNSSTSTRTNNAANENDQTNVPLDQYLRKIPGLRITGAGTSAKVQISSIGNSSLVGSNSPLFVLDGVNVGTSLGQVSNLVQTSNIKTVRVLKTASETSFYGAQGANGVIVIKTKK